MVYPPHNTLSPNKPSRFDDNPFEKFRIQRSSTHHGPLLGSNTSAATGFRSRKRHSRYRLLRYTAAFLVSLGWVLFIWPGFLKEKSDIIHDAEYDGSQDDVWRVNAEKTKAHFQAVSTPLVSVGDGHVGERTQIGKEKATLVMLVRNRELKFALKSIKQIEDRFNHKYHYPWTFLNDEPFTVDFIEWTTKRASGKTEYGLIPKEQWSVPPHIDGQRLSMVLKGMKVNGVIYGDSIPYRHMCRYNSGFFWRHELLEKYDYYWRVEPEIGFFCDQEYDPFVFMRENKKKYGFVVSLPEYKDTIPTLWSTTQDFIKANPEYLAPKSSLRFIVDNNKGMEGDYNLCHFWSNFEIADLNFWRGEAYTKYFEYLDQKGGFYYERWGDAPVHSLAAALFLNMDELHWFHDIGYKHPPFGRCPFSDKDSMDYARCVCPFEEKDNFDASSYSCMPKWWSLNGLDLKTGNKIPSPEGA